METVANGDCSAQAPVESITVHDFSEKILEQQVNFHVMKLSGGFFLWIGSNPVLSNLAVSIVSKYDSMPLSTLVLGDTSDTTPSSLAQRLTKKTKKQVFVSYNLPMTDSSLALLVEDRIKKEMELHPDKF
ncbi:proteasome assembly chaperone 4-like [Ctenopharyngodon idella]|uniref:proteasome assembly chaperone 4 n=1 Tax=Ctenopharyngodon idella TaxID=7959 RepID=UPI00222FA3E9|nr:proteasome assembly chaperone 4 [Ctenopharyngodon idella]XP_051731564.1 proteasome assembly chaperone 4-like [Ctenopharyngodon idella]